MDFPLAHGSIDWTPEPTRTLSWLRWPTSSHGPPGRYSPAVTTTDRKPCQHKQCGKDAYALEALRAPTFPHYDDE